MTFSIHPAGGKRSVSRKDLERVLASVPSVTEDGSLGSGVKNPSAADPVVNPVVSGPFSIQELSDRYVLCNIFCDGGVRDISWSKALLDAGKSHTQDEWVKLTKNEEFKLPSGPMYGESFLALFNHRKTPDAGQKKLVEKIIGLFQTDFDPAKPYLITSTRVVYAARGFDLVTHNYGYSNQTKPPLQKNVVGPNGYLSAGNCEDYAEALLGSKDVQVLNDALVWITGKRPYAHRVNQKPSNDQNRVLRVGCGDYSFDVCTSDGIYGNWPARGGVASAQKKSVNNGGV